MTKQISVVELNDRAQDDREELWGDVLSVPPSREVQRHRQGSELEAKNLSAASDIRKAGLIINLLELKAGRT